jgi:hypothetical protein
MIILSNDQKSITINMTNDIYPGYDRKEKCECYNINPPYVSCTYKQDAEFIQKEVNNFINKLCKELMK